MRRSDWSAVLAALALIALTGCGGGGDANTSAADSAAAAPPPAATPTPAPTATAGTPPQGATPEMVAAGQQTFAQVCSTCHGPDAKGTQLAPNLTDAEWLHGDGTYQFIITTVTNGVPQPKNAPAPMLPKGGAQLTDQQVKDVSAYVWSLGGGK